MFDGKAFGAEVVGVVKDYLERHLSQVVARLDEIERRMSELPVPKDGKDADTDAVADIVSNRMAAEIDELRSLIAGIPPAIELPDIPAMVSAAVEATPAPQDGKSVTVEELRPLVEESVSKAVSALPVAKDGRPGKDGVGLAGAIIDRSGNLTLTLTDGSTRDLGLIVGKDAEPGKPGKDGLGFDDMTEELADDGRTIIRRYSRGDQVKEFRHTFPVVLDRGVFKEGQTYHPGDGVTWAGSFWIAQEETSEKPDSGKGFRLAVKRGRDGKDGLLKEAPSGKVKI